MGQQVSSLEEEKRKKENTMYDRSGSWETCRFRVIEEERSELGLDRYPPSTFEHVPKQVVAEWPKLNEEPYFLRMKIIPWIFISSRQTLF